jgi:hypothetical protein
MQIKSAYRPSPRCPHCDQPTRFARSVPNFGAQAALHSFECDLCGLAVVKPGEAELLELAPVAMPA